MTDTVEKIEEAIELKRKELADLQATCTQVDSAITSNRLQEIESKKSLDKALEEEKIVEARITTLRTEEKVAEGAVTVANDKKKVAEEAAVEAETKLTNLNADITVAEINRDKALEEEEEAYTNRDNARAQSELDLKDISTKLTDLKKEFEDEEKDIAEKRAVIAGNLKTEEDNYLTKQKEIRDAMGVLETFEAEKGRLTGEIEVLERTKTEREASNEETERKTIAARSALIRVEDEIIAANGRLEVLRTEENDINTKKLSLASKEVELEGREAMLKDRYKTAGIAW